MNEDILKNYKKSVSPLIATILLIVVAVAIIVIVINWGKSFTTDSLDDTRGVTTFTTSDATHFIFRPEVKGDLVSFTYSPPASLKNKTISFDRYSVAGYDTIIELDEPVTLREGTTFFSIEDIFQLDILERIITLQLYTLDGQVIILKNLKSNFEFVCESGPNGPYYVLCYVDDFDYVRDNLDGNFLLGRNIDFLDSGFWIEAPLNINTTTDNWNDGNGFIPIGSVDSPFTGNFNGNGYTLSNLYINLSSTNYVGLFGYFDNKGSIKHLNLSDVNITGNDITGGLVGGSLTEDGCNSQGDGLINNHVTGYVTGNDKVGGIVGGASEIKYVF